MLYFSRWKAAAILLTALVVCLFAVPNFFAEATVTELADMGAAPHRARARPAGRLAHPARGRSAAVRKDKVEALRDDVRRMLRERRIGYTGRGDPRQHRRGAHPRRRAIRSSRSTQAARTVAAARRAARRHRPAHGRRHRESGGVITLTPTEPGDHRAHPPGGRPVDPDRRAARQRARHWSSRLIQRQGVDRILVQVPGLGGSAAADGAHRQDRQARLPHGRPDR